MNGSPEELDDRIRHLVTLGHNTERLELARIVKEIITKSTKTSNQEIERLVNHVVCELMDNKYAEGIRHANFEDKNIMFEARCDPCPRGDGTPFYVSGDSHIFYKLGGSTYLIGRIDGMGHGPTAGVLVLVARRYLDDLIHRGINDPLQLTEQANDLYYYAVSPEHTVSFTTMFLTLLENRRLLFTNMGDGDTFLYCPQRNRFERAGASGLYIGTETSQVLKDLGLPFKEEERHVLPGFTIVSYTDGISTRINFDPNNIVDIITSNHGRVLKIINGIFDYAHSLVFEGEPDDATVVCLYVK